MPDVSFLYPESFFRIRVGGQWTRQSAGGCGNTGEEDLLRNPQFQLVVPEPPQADMFCFGQIVLTQEDVRWTQSQHEMYSIGFHIFRSPPEGGRITVENNWNLHTEMSSGTYINRRAATALIKHIQPGKSVQLMPLVIGSLHFQFNTHFMQAPM